MWTAVAELPVSPSYLSDTALEPELELIHQWKPTPESDTGCCALDLDGRPAGPSSPHCGRGPDCGRKKNGCPLPIHLCYRVYDIKPMYPSGGHGRGSLLAPGGCVHPGEKTGPRSEQTLLASTHL